MSDRYFNVLYQKLALGQHLQEAGFVLSRAFHRTHHNGYPFLMYKDEDLWCGLRESPRIECESQPACCWCPWPIIARNKRQFRWNFAPREWQNEPRGGNKIWKLRKQSRFLFPAHATATSNGWPRAKEKIIGI